MRKILNILLLILILSSCGTGASNKNNTTFKLLNSYKIKVPEPSGLSFAENKEALYTVSDETNKIYKLSLEGEVLQEISCNAKDLEGISYNTADTSIWLADEKSRRLINVNLQGETLKTIDLDIKSKDKNSGIEGLTINHNNGNMFCLNEKKPGLLIKINKNGDILETHKLDFAKDYSGVYHDSNSNKLWIVSDKSMTITVFDEKGQNEHTYETNIESMEGIAIDSKNKLMYIVSDDLERLFVFRY